MAGVRVVRGNLCWMWLQMVLVAGLVVCGSSRSCANDAHEWGTRFCTRSCGGADAGAGGAFAGCGDGSGAGGADDYCERGQDCGGGGDCRDAGGGRATR
jgi:hypothetical protein